MVIYGKRHERKKRVESENDSFELIELFDKCQYYYGFIKRRVTKTIVVYGVAET